jgi:hypothetical protein
MVDLPRIPFGSPDGMETLDTDGTVVHLSGEGSEEVKIVRVNAADVGYDFYVGETRKFRILNGKLLVETAFDLTPFSSNPGGANTLWLDALGALFLGATPIASGTPPGMYRSRIPAGETLCVPPDYQFYYHGAYTVDGELCINGEAVFSGGRYIE